jgi:hypothetical protein
MGSTGRLEEAFVYTAMGMGRASAGDISWQDYTFETNYKIYKFGQWGVLRVYFVSGQFDETLFPTEGGL